MAELWASTGAIWRDMLLAFLDLSITLLFRGEEAYAIRVI